jgi:hypothetical protein
VPRVAVTSDERMRYPRVGEHNATQSLALALINVNADATVVDVQSRQLQQALTSALPEQHSEYLLRCGWIDNIDELVTSCNY